MDDVLMFLKLVGKTILYVIGTMVVAVFAFIMLIVYIINQIQIWLLD
jgi:hypothetical protein